jgi:hypothetical protein
MSDCLIWQVFLFFAEAALIFVGYFFHGEGYAFVLTKKYWAIFFTNSSGHPAGEPFLKA